MKKKKIILFLILFIILVFSILTISKILVINKINNQLSKFGNETNYHMIKNYYTSTGVIIDEEWIDRDTPNGMFKEVLFDYDDCKKVVTYSLSYDNSLKYYSENSEGEISVTDEYEIEKLDKEEEVPTISNKADYLKKYLKNIFKYSISSEKINGVDCYKIKGFFDDYIYFIDKNTGELVREVFYGESGPCIGDYSWKFDCVTEKDYELLKNIDIDKE